MNAFWVLVGLVVWTGVIALLVLVVRAAIRKQRALAEQIRTRRPVVLAVFCWEQELPESAGTLQLPIDLARQRHELDFELAAAKVEVRGDAGHTPRERTRTFMAVAEEHREVCVDVFELVTGEVEVALGGGSVSYFLVPAQGEPTP